MHTEPTQDAPEIASSAAFPLALVRDGRPVTVEVVVALSPDGDLFLYDAQEEGAQVYLMGAELEAALAAGRAELVAVEVEARTPLFEDYAIAA